MTTSERRERLLRTAAEVFAEQGYAASMRDIGRRAGIHNGSLYYHFDSKDALLTEVLKPYFDAVATSYAKIFEAKVSAVDALSSLIRETLALAHAHITSVQIIQRDWHRLAETFAFIRTGLHEAERIWVGVIERGMDQGVFRKDLDPRLVYRSIRSALYDAAYWDARSRRIPFDQLGEMQVALFTQGITQH